MNKKILFIFLTSITIFILMILLLHFQYVDRLDFYGKSIQKLFFHSSFYTIFLVITNIMSIVGITIILVITTYCLRKKGETKNIILYITTILICLIVTNAIKIIVKRTRPLDRLLEVSGFSFPSSHSSVSMVVYGYLILLINKYYGGKRKKVYIALCVMMILLTGLSRIYFGVHYLTDVIGGFSLGMIILCISSLAPNFK